MQAITGTRSARVRRAGLLLAAAIAFALSLAGSAAASTAYSAASARPQPIPGTSWRGRPIRRAQKPVPGPLLDKVAFPTGWSAGVLRYGAGYHQPGGSEAVRDVQRELTTLGYRPGPIDGRYGPLTRSALQWFQIKHGLRPTGVAAAATLAALRDPKGFTQSYARAIRRTVQTRPSTPAATKLPQPAQPQPARAATRAGGAPTWLIAALLTALVVALAVVMTVVRLATRPRPGPRTQPQVSSAPVLGYLPAESDQGPQEAEQAIAEACRERGWTLARLVHEVEGAGVQPAARPGLKYALDQLTEGTASRLVVSKLEHLARSFADLGAVLGWFMRAGVALTVLDVGLDTGTPQGRSVMRTLLSVCRAQRTRVGSQTHNRRTAARATRRRAVEDSPETSHGRTER